MVLRKRKACEQAVQSHPVLRGRSKLVGVCTYWYVKVSNFHSTFSVRREVFTKVLPWSDEVESLAAARQAALNGSDPSDAIRVVNALLTQLDKLKQHPNVMVLTTSNLTHAIDLAFIDRADIKAFIGPPSLQGRYNMLHSSFCELQRVGIVEEVEGNTDYPSTYNELMLSDCDSEDMGSSKGVQLGKKLLEVAKACEGLSGRILRKLPFLAHATSNIPGACSADSFIDKLQSAVQKELEDRNNMATSLFSLSHPAISAAHLIPSYLLLIPSHHLCSSSHHTIPSHPICTIFSPHRIPLFRLLIPSHHLCPSSHHTISSHPIFTIFSPHPIPPSVPLIPSHHLFSPVSPSFLLIPSHYSASSSHPTISAPHPITPSL
ncbi:unnamed protein product [Closterium sp. Naga37s-1]|nr:unnamed protein product [Closterium sp. Naga37s-1]